ncbi:39S ribosomal protein L9, mitochondrial-like [Myxocyprinus asiaticus]|uniref:39S ribosomal protein L9, mitochondrial-like n=1 Tax=Myxocyprinus asiaticus TaxID=70543 RepID=UPI0022225103|nr:39S ribosomal protein L9, mitochondrial-like [Myxocyprinus asiaticus]
MLAAVSSRFVLQGCWNLSNLQSSLNRIQNLSQTACKNTVIVERWWKVPLSKEGKPPRLHPRRHKVYRLVEDTKHNNTQEKMELILTQTVPKLGGRGDTVSVRKSVGRNSLLPQGLAVYPSQENKDMFAEERRLLREGRPEDRVQTRTGQLTVEFLKKTQLEVAMHTSIQYSLTKEIVCRQFVRRLGVVVPTHALTLPEEPITGPGEFWCNVTVNGVDTVRVSMSVVPFVGPSQHWLMKKQEDTQQSDSE